MYQVILIASPLGGAFTWCGVVTELRERGHAVLVVEPVDDERLTTPLWMQAVQAVAAQIDESWGPESSLLLVAHSGAGTLLPAIGHLLPGRVAGYISVDGPVPREGASQLSLMRRSAPGLADVVTTALDAGGRFPVMEDTHLRREIPDDALRRRVLDEGRPRDVRFYNEVVAVPLEWPDAPGGYLQLSDGQAPAAAEAASLGWARRRMSGHHFLMVTEPAAVAQELLSLSLQMLAAVPAQSTDEIRAGSSRRR